MEQNHQVPKLSIHYQYKVFQRFGTLLIHILFKAASKPLTIFDQSKEF